MQIDGETVRDFIFGGSKITADGDCSQEIKRCLLLGRKAMRNLDRIFKSRDITNLTYANDIILTAESEEEVKSCLIKGKEESKKSWLKTQHSKK